MGGGDLNTKKSWHPSTIKNQERVWKAEQAALEEKKRILELQREREQENERAQLNEMAQRNFGHGGGSNQVGDNRLHWMYDKPDKQVQHEDYLLGKEIGKSDECKKPQNAIPAVSRRVVGSSMTKSQDDTQVDLVRKMREDPLLLVKERERAARAALLNNPLQRKRLAELLRKEKEQTESKEDCKTKKKSKKKDECLDNILAAKLNALGGDKKIDLSCLLNSNDSSSSDSSQSSDEKSKKKQKKKKKEKKKKHSKTNKTKKDDFNSVSDEDKRHQPSDKNVLEYQSYYGTNIESTKYADKKNNKHEYNHKSTRDRDDVNDDTKKKNREKFYDKHQKSTSYTINNYKSSDYRKRQRDSYSETEGKTSQKKSKREYSAMNKSDSERDKRSTPQSDKKPERERSSAFESGKRVDRERRQGLSSADRAAKLEEMAAAGRQREVERGQRVKQQRAADAAVADTPARPRSLNNEARALPDSLESRIRSNKHYIQRDKMHMNQNFARR